MRLIRLRKKELALEISDWVELNLISSDQARSICELYGMDYDSRQNRSAGLRLLTLLGIFFIGLALITLIGANWDTIPRSVRLSGLLSLTAAAHGIGIWSYHKNKEGYAVGMCLLGNLFYGASIILIAQIYHLGEHMPDGIFWWAFGTLPMGVLMRSSLLVSISGVLALIWFFLELVTGFLELTVFTAVFPVFIIAELYTVIRNRTSTFLFLTLCISTSVWILTFLGFMWMNDPQRSVFIEEHFLIGIILLTFAWSLGRWLYASDNQKAKDYGTRLSFWTLLATLLTLLVMSFEGNWEHLVETDWNHQVSMWITAGSIAGSTVWFGYKTGKLFVAGALILSSSMIMLAVTVFQIHPIYLQLIVNCALVIIGAYLIYLGTTRGISHYFYLGLSIILLTALLRYIDLIADYIGTSILFMGFAAILLGSVRFWSRKHSGRNPP